MGKSKDIRDCFLSLGRKNDNMGINVSKHQTTDIAGDRNGEQCKRVSAITTILLIRNKDYLRYT